jgi:hypothetical protein
MKWSNLWAIGIIEGCVMEIFCDWSLDCSCDLRFVLIFRHTGFQLVDAKSNKIVGFMVSNYSVSRTHEQWIHLLEFFLYSCGEYVPEIFVPVVYPKYVAKNYYSFSLVSPCRLIKTCYERGLNVYKKMHVMVKGDYFMDDSGVYCPSAEYWLQSCLDVGWTQLFD